MQLPVVTSHEELAVVGIRRGPIPLAARLLVYGTSLLVVGGFLWVPAVGLALARRVATMTWRQRVLLAIAFGAFAYIPRAPHHRARRWWLWEAWLRYFNVHVVFADPLEQMRVAAAAAHRRPHPHGLWRSVLHMLALLRWLLTSLASNALEDVQSVVAPRRRGPGGSRSGRSLTERFAAPEPRTITAAAPLGRAIYAISPHGVFPFSMAMGLVGGFTDLWGRLRPVAADVVLRVPMVGHLVRALGGMPARYSIMKAALEAGRPIAVCPGGIGEMFHAATVGDPPGAPETIILRNRRGIVRLALETGEWRKGVGGGV